jgi:hypothetical protein
MFRLFTTFFAAGLFAGALAASAPAQQMPYPPSSGYGPTSAPASNAPTNAALLGMAKKWFADLQSGHVDRSQIEGGPYSNLNDATIANAQKMVGGLGKPVSFVQQELSTQGNITAAIYLVGFQNGQKVNFLFAVDSQGKVASLGLGTPH